MDPDRHPDADVITLIAVLLTIAVIVAALIVVQGTPHTPVVPGPPP